MLAGLKVLGGDAENLRRECSYGLAAALRFSLRAEHLGCLEATLMLLYGLPARSISSVAAPADAAREQCAICSPRPSPDCHNFAIRVAAAVVTTPSHLTARATLEPDERMLYDGLWVHCES